MAKSLVVVESPAKARTLGRFLGNRYRVEASFGHVRDLPESAREVPEAIRKQPWGRLGVDTDGEFTPYYVIPSDKRRHVQSLKTALKDASEILLATDPDREGESISWHLLQVLKPKVPVRRIVFHEITEEAVREALQSPQQVDENLVSWRGVHEASPPALIRTRSDVSVFPCDPRSLRVLRSLRAHAALRKLAP